jgi:hypothetical protein
LVEGKVLQVTRKYGRIGGAVPVREGVKEGSQGEASGAEGEESGELAVGIGVGEMEETAPGFK